MASPYALTVCRYTTFSAAIFRPDYLRPGTMLIDITPNRKTLTTLNAGSSLAHFPFPVSPFVVLKSAAPELAEGKPAPTRPAAGGRSSRNLIQ